MPRKIIVSCFVLFLLFGAALTATASHLVGGKMTYRYLGATGSMESYEVTLTLYEDCYNGQPDAIAQDNPAYFGVYEQETNKLVTIDTNVQYTSSIVVPLNSINPCAIQNVNICLIEKQFTTVFNLAPSTHGYVVSYQRCCFSINNINISNPGNTGITYFCTIPPSGIQNNSAVFKNYTQRMGCINNLLTVDLSATDADGDSLTYELTDVLAGASEFDIKPVPTYPPYNNVIYTAPSTTTNPLGISKGMTLDPLTGMLSCVPDRVGFFALAANCLEWRHGVLINKVYHQFQVVVVNCGSSLLLSAGKDTSVIKGSSIQLAASGGVKYHWSSSAGLSSDSIANPIGFFPNEGVYNCIASITNGSGCIINDTIKVTVLGYSELFMPNAFTPDKDNLNDVFKPEFIGPCDVKYLKIYNRYGNLVYNGTEGWDGTYNGQNQDVGVYCWLLLYTNSIGQSKMLKGNVTLLR